MTTQETGRADSAPPAGAPPQSDAGKAFGWTYWILNSIEAFERLAYFGIRYVVPIYIMQATEPGGLHLTAVHKGWIYMWWAIFQSWLPMFTGGIADRYGYKRVLFMAISANVVGYLIMAYTHDYYGFFAGILVLATGTAFFKPALQGSLAQKLTKQNASMGWGIFYWVVNVGAVLAPLLATLILGQPHSAAGWRNLFLASAAYTATNLLLLLTFKDVPSGADKSLSVMKVFAATIENIWPYWFKEGRFHRIRGPLGLAISLAGLSVVILRSEQWAPGVALFLGGGVLASWLEGGRFTWQLRLPAFLLIMSCFWMMMYQVWDLHPNFIEDWIDSSSVADRVPFESWREYGDRGLVRVPQQILITLNAALIVLLVVPISWGVRKMRTLSAMLIGMSVATGGILVAGLTGNGWILLLGIVFFSLGEMLTGPKKNQYLGLIAPPGKKGLYLGYVNIPVGVGVGLGSIIAGVVYDNYGEKATLALKELASRPALVARAAQAADWSDALHKIPALLHIDRSEAFAIARASMGTDADRAAQTLRESFKNDKGQIDNLALQYLALHPDNRATTIKGFNKLISVLGEQLGGKIRTFSAQVDAYLEPAGPDGASTATTLPAAPTPGAHAAMLATAGEIRHEADVIESMTVLVRDLASGDRQLEQAGVARFVDRLPEVIGEERVAAFELVRDLVNKGLSGADVLADAEIVDMLWAQLGARPEVLNNLALEYLAQATPRLRDAVAARGFDSPVERIHERIAEMEEHLGIGRTKSFTALSVALGATDEEVDETLGRLDMPRSDPAARAYVYLAGLAHHRFLAVARRDWARDRKLLREMIRSDAEALDIVRARIDDETWYQRAFSRLKSAFVAKEEVGEATEEGVDYRILARKQDLIQKALEAKDWTKAPDQAARLLSLNPFEARALVAAEVTRSPQTTTKMLWETYSPQYKVWIPFATIGALAAIALAVFGQMAKRWADMNA